jgi:hypothetical protein
MHRFHLAAVLALGASALSAQSAAPNAQPAGAASPVVAPAVAAPAPQGPNATAAPSAKRTERPDVAEKGSALSILVYDENTTHGYAATAAFNLSFFGTTFATAANFNSLLTSGSWDVVAVDCPSNLPTGGWSSLINYVNGGGEVVLSYWDWNNVSGSSAGLAAAFDVSVSSSISLSGATLTDSGTSPAFLGVTMPNASWHDHWTDDGDQFNLLGGAQGIAHVGTASTPVMARGNGGKTIAAPLLDEGGDTWLSDGSAVQLWENLIMMVGFPGPSILVYDNDTVHSLAQTAAFEESPGGTQVANQTTFNGLLTSGTWEAVLVDAPNFTPTGGWTSLINYVNGGGHVAMSFWDWDNSSAGFGDPALPGAFDVSVVSSFSWLGLTLFDSGVSDLFSGVSMPNSSWHDDFIDDGDRFTPVGPAAKGVAHVGSASQPAVVWGNSGRTLAAPVLDEAGDVWLGNGSGVQLWKNMLEHVTEPEALCTQRNGILGLNPVAYTCITPPVVGGLWVANVNPTPTFGGQTLTTFVTLGLGGPVQGFPIFGFELLILPPYFETTGFGTHNIPVSPNPLLVGVTIPSQGARLELVGGTIKIILTNGQDVTFGF